MSTMHSSQVLAKAIADMQSFYGLQVTGEMDPATIRSDTLKHTHANAHTLP